jgi:outer membrane biosynthesis protein TonB
MGRKVAIPWHATFTIAAGVLYFFFVLPRWPELMGETTHSLGTTLRIVTGALVALAALPVVFTQLRTRKPELGTPQLALTIRVWSIVAHVLAGGLIIGAAISEIWLSLDAAGRWLFGVYGAAAAIALLGVFAFYLSFIAELPPPPPKPLKPKTEKQRKKRGRGKKGDETEEAKGAEPEAEEAAETDEAEAPEQAEEPEEAAETEVTASEPSEDTQAAPAAQDTEEGEAAEETQAGLRNRRPTGKGSHRMRRRRTRGGVALDE